MCVNITLSQKKHVKEMLKRFGWWNVWNCEGSQSNTMFTCFGCVFVQNESWNQSGIKYPNCFDGQIGVFHCVNPEVQKNAGKNIGSSNKYSIWIDILNASYLQYMSMMYINYIIIFLYKNYIIIFFKKNKFLSYPLGITICSASKLFTSSWQKASNGDMSPNPS